MFAEKSGYSSKKKACWKRCVGIAGSTIVFLLVHTLPFKVNQLSEKPMQQATISDLQRHVLRPDTKLDHLKRVLSFLFAFGCTNIAAHLQ